MNISETKYNCLKIMTNDLMRFEEFINDLGVETRTDKAGDDFRNIADIINDIVIICNNNPTILNECKESISKKHNTSYQIDEFQSKYNWIEVKDFLPKENQEVFITFINSTGRHTELATFKEGGFYYISETDNGTYEEIFPIPIAWMKKPDVYQG
jgi:hypothetical protein